MGFANNLFTDTGIHKSSILPLFNKHWFIRNIYYFGKYAQIISNEHLKNCSFLNFELQFSFNVSLTHKMKSESITH